MLARRTWFGVACGGRAGVQVFKGEQCEAANLWRGERRTAIFRPPFVRVVGAGCTVRRYPACSKSFPRFALQDTVRRA